MSRWSGSASRRARAALRPLVEGGGATCCRCGRPIRPGTSWQADHWPIAREHGGTEIAPAHSRCNLAAGGRRGAQLTNSRRWPAYPAASRNIRGV